MFDVISALLLREGFGEVIRLLLFHSAQRSDVGASRQYAAMSIGSGASMKAFIRLGSYGSGITVSVLSVFLLKFTHYSEIVALGEEIRSHRLRVYSIGQINIK